jgi:hypothetical protein
VTNLTQNTVTIFAVYGKTGETMYIEQIQEGGLVQQAATTLQGKE